MTTIALDDHPLVTPLAAFATLPGWLAAGMDPDAVAASLTAHVPELAAGDLRLLSCTPERLRAKGEEWLARYTVRVAAPDGEARDVVLVGTLRPPAAPTPSQLGSQDPAAGEQPTTGPGGPLRLNADRRADMTAAFGEPGWSCRLPELRMELAVQTEDEALPALPRLVEPAAAADLLEPLVRDAGYRHASIASCTPEVVRYKPGSRCTVVVEVTYATSPGPDEPTPPSPVVLKTHQGDKGEAAWAAMTALWQRPDSWAGAVSLAEPLGYLPEERILVQGPVPGRRTLKELAREAIAAGSPALLDELRAALATTARALAAVHGSGATYGRTATLEEELAEVTEMVDRLSLSEPALPAAAGPLLRRLAELSDQQPADPVVSAHHDFRPAQVLLDDAAVGFIDFDGACMAEPALDLGRFRAKLRDIGISAVGTEPAQGAGGRDEVLPLLDELCDGFLAAYQDEASVSPERVLLWETCDLVTTMLHAWSKVRLARVEPRLAVLVHQLRSSPLLDGDGHASKGHF